VIIDTSVLIAILKNEADCVEYEMAMTASKSQLFMSAATYLEAAIVADAVPLDRQVNYVDDLVATLQLTIAPVTEVQARIARQAYRQYGKGSGHKAQLNFGDCFAYALAKDMNQPLLFKGNDFSQTDVDVALA
jgi:ribonuclease VapC